MYKLEPIHNYQLSASIVFTLRLASALVAIGVDFYFRNGHLLSGVSIGVGYADRGVPGTDRSVRAEHQVVSMYDGPVGGVNRGTGRARHEAGRRWHIKSAVHSVHVALARARSGRDFVQHRVPVVWLRLHARVHTKEHTLECRFELLVEVCIDGWIQSTAM